MDMRPTSLQRALFRPRLRLRLGTLLKWGAALIAIGLMADILYALLTLPPLPAGGISPDRPSMVYAMDGTEIGPLSDIFRIPVDIKEVPDHLINAYIASEDVRFHQHLGVDPRGILRALVTNLLAGEIQEGGSTITQQVVRMAFLTTKQTLNRKIQEAALALLLERQYTKQEILNMYLNQVYLGNGAYGVGAGAKLYFDKDVADLTLGEAAMLAGITPSPENYNPLLKPDIAERQRNIVLDRMVVAGYLTAEEAEAEKAKPLEIRQGRLDTVQRYPWYMEAVRRELRDRYHLDERVIDLMGLKIYTGLDPALQAAAEQAMEARIFPESVPDGLQGAFVAIDPRNGEVRALVGGRNKPVSGGFNRATDGRIAPGSAFKPVMVYAPAFEYAGLTPESKVEDTPININGWQPKNWDGQYRGTVTVREAARLSLNPPAVRMLQMVGLPRAKQMAQRLGIRFAEGDDSLTLALGAMQEGISPLQLAAAYQAFANGGYYYEPHLVTRVEAVDGVLKPKALEARRAMSSRTAYLVTDILQTVVQSGTGTGAKLDRPMAGKTGTVELPSSPEFTGLEGNAAAWFVGYTPDLVAAVWLGYDQIDPQHYLPSSINGSTYPTTLWRRIVGTALSGRPALAFPGVDGKPSGVAQRSKPAAPQKPEPQPEPEPEPVQLQPVTGVTLLPGSSPGEVVLVWSGSLPENAQGRVAYRIFRGGVPNVPLDEAHTLATVTENLYVDHPPAGGTYYYRVAMVDLTTQTLGTPSAPVGVVLLGPSLPGPGEGEGTPGTGNGPSDGGTVTPGTGNGGQGGEEVLEELPPNPPQQEEGQPRGGQPGGGEPGGAAWARPLWR